MVASGAGPLSGMRRIGHPLAAARGATDSASAKAVPAGEDHAGYSPQPDLHLFGNQASRVVAIGPRQDHDAVWKSRQLREGGNHLADQTRLEPHDKDLARLQSRYLSPGLFVEFGRMRQKDRSTVGGREGRRAQSIGVVLPGGQHHGPGSRTEARLRHHDGRLIPVGTGQAPVFRGSLSLRRCRQDQHTRQL